ncbi:unnamed protein product [Somion occarium]|uniref:Uncharacterized protein n=1 Tax=Somion occarium TaxID=3059160 RepID=A0ABP1DWD1_9APHY
MSKKGAHEQGEEEWRQIILQLTIENKRYQDASKSKNSSAIAQHSESIPALMYRAADVHPDPKVKEKFRKNAETWGRAGTDEREEMTHPIAKGLAMLLVAPFVMAGGVVFAAGAILYGAGMVFVGLGDALTFGRLRS